MTRGAKTLSPSFRRKNPYDHESPPEEKASRHPDPQSEIFFHAGGGKGGRRLTADDLSGENGFDGKKRSTFEGREKRIGRGLYFSEEKRGKADWVEQYVRQKACSGIPRRKRGGSGRNVRSQTKGNFGQNKGGCGPSSSKRFGRFEMPA